MSSDFHSEVNLITQEVSKVFTDCFWQVWHFFWCPSSHTHTLLCKTDRYQNCRAICHAKAATKSRWTSAHSSAVIYILFVWQAFIASRHSPLSHYSSALSDRSFILESKVCSPKFSSVGILHKHQHSKQQPYSLPFKRSKWPCWRNQILDSSEAPIFCFVTMSILDRLISVQFPRPILSQ